MLDPNRRQKRVFYGAFFPVCFFFFFLRLVCAAYNGAKYTLISCGLAEGCGKGDGKGLWRGRQWAHKRNCKLY